MTSPQIEKLLEPFGKETRAALRPILNRQERINRAFLRRINQMALDLTKLNQALADVQAFVKSHQDTGAADQAAVDGVAQQIIAAVTPATPVPPPAQ